MVGILAQTTSPNSTVATVLDEFEGSVTRRSHSESRDELRRIPSQSADEVMAQRHVAADPRFES